MRDRRRETVDVRRETRVIQGRLTSSVSRLPTVNIRRMSLADTKKEFIAVRTARGLASRKLFEERAPGVLRQTVYAALADEVEKERTLDEEARRMMETARGEIASGRVDGQEL